MILFSTGLRGAVEIVSLALETFFVFFERRAFGIQFDPFGVVGLRLQLNFSRFRVEIDGDPDGS